MKHEFERTETISPGARCPNPYGPIATDVRYKCLRCGRVCAGRSGSGFLMLSLTEASEEDCCPTEVL